jgi:hypothetical protein
MALQDYNSTQMSGGSEEGFNFGLDYSGLAQADAANIAGMPAQIEPGNDGVNIGAVSQEVGALQHDVMAGLSSDYSAEFNDQVHPADAGGVDAMRGIAGGADVVIPATLSNEDMYLAQPQNVLDGTPSLGQDELVGSPLEQ